MALNVQPSILKTKTGHLPDPANGDDQFREFALLADAASAASNNGNYSNSYHTPTKRKKQDPKTGKGLRHFSMKVSSVTRLLFGSAGIKALLLCFAPLHYPPTARPFVCTA